MVKVNMLPQIDRRTFDRNVLNQPDRRFRNAAFIFSAVLFAVLSFAVVFVNLH